MTKLTDDLSGQLRGNVGWVLMLVLVAGSAFLLGSSYRQQKTPAATVGSSHGSKSTASANAISDISASLQTPTSVPTGFDPTASASTTGQTSHKTTTGVVNINTGTEAELDSLPGIGPAKAKAIISYRQQNGPFVNPEDIEKVKGIGPKTFASLKSLIAI